MPTRTQQLGLIIVLAALTLYVLISVGCGLTSTLSLQVLP
jgi:hypothetical protein